MMARSRLPLDFEHLDKLFGVKPEEKLIYLKPDAEGKPASSLNAQQLYNWEREAWSQLHFMTYPPALKGGGFRGLQPVISMDYGWRIEIPDVEEFYVYGTILSQREGESPYVRVNPSTQIKPSVKARPNEKIFIAHHHSDNPEATTLDTLLSATYETFLDRRDLSPAQDFDQVIEHNLGNSDYLVLLMSPQALASPYVEKEWRWWLIQKPAGTIIPVMIKRVKPPSELKAVKYITYKGDLPSVTREIAYAVGVELRPESPRAG